MARTLCSPGCSVMENRTQTARQMLRDLKYRDLGHPILVAIRNPKEMQVLPRLDQAHANRGQYS
jgi:hypothetical protein